MTEDGGAPRRVSEQTGEYAKLRRSPTPPAVRFNVKSRRLDQPPAVCVLRNCWRCWRSLQLRNQVDDTTVLLMEVPLRLHPRAHWRACQRRRSDDELLRIGVELGTDYGVMPATLPDRTATSRWMSSSTASTWWLTTLLSISLKSAGSVTPELPTVT